ncbi:microsomal signal peptidase 12 kDa subunit-domain-containing protein [Rhodotorula diobovata]|uniref:Signal peptidase complex subunit 1 n=1 Tax=Rhodotorula diobovata TaxID=5288 RepID=A0A5C5FZK8_9BASI|nr:microsomal signal peptidase 12 kDa subunit-domain-containing protein [Rhodotorula diobovata]
MDLIHAKVDQLKDSLEGKIDFVGQDIAEQRAKWLLWSSALVAFVVGAALQSVRLSLGIFATGFLATLALVLPPLPAYTAHPVKWLDTLDDFGEPLLPAPELGAAGGATGAAATAETRKDR